MSLTRLKNRTISKFTTRIPVIAKISTDAFTPIETQGIPWTPVKKPLTESRVALITTAGVHHKDHAPFNMEDRDGDPTFRNINPKRSYYDLMITHDYYDHSNADKDMNIVFPLQRLIELQREGLIGECASNHYGFMGHILGRHIHTLLHESAPAVANRLLKDNVDLVFLTPG